MNNYTMNPTVIILGIILIVLVYVLYVYFFSSSSTLSTSLNLNNYPIPVITNIDTPTSTRYAYSIWVYVNSWSNNQQHTIFTVSPGTTATNSSLKLYLNKSSPTLYCDFGMTTDVTDGNKTSKVIISNNFPLQKWVYITISVDNQFVDCYLDGKLVKSTKVIDSFGSGPPPPSAKSTIMVGNGNSAFDAFVANFQRSTTPLDPQTVWTNYLYGNGGSSYSNYGMNVNILKNNSLMHKYQVF